MGLTGTKLLSVMIFIVKNMIKLCVLLILSLMIHIIMSAVDIVIVDSSNDRDYIGQWSS
jgi:hypothetical protein